MESADPVRSMPELPDTLTLEGSQHIGRCSNIRDNHVDIARRADKRGTHIAEFARIRDNDDLFGLFEHLAIDKRLVGLQRGGSPFSVQTCDTEENLIHIDIVKKLKSRFPVSENDQAQGITPPVK